MVSFALYGNLDQFPPKNLVGRFISHNWMLGRITHFYNPKHPMSTTDHKQLFCGSWHSRRQKNLDMDS